MSIYDVMINDLILKKMINLNLFKHIHMSSYSAIYLSNKLTTFSIASNSIITLGISSFKYYIASVWAWKFSKSVPCYTC